jgi:N6-L-threonylcarbamoyladenine synthase
MASRAHSERIISLFDRFLKALSWTAHDFSKQVDSISVTVTPGLPGSLIIGKTFAQLLSQRYNKPLVEVNHLYGHVLSILLDRNINDIQFPLVVLSASGGHSDLYLVKKLE